MAVTALTIAALTLVGCSTSSTEGPDTPAPGSTELPPGPSGSPIAEALDCASEGYPCTWATVPTEVVLRSRELGASAQAQRVAQGSRAAAAWLAEQDGVAEAIADDEAVRFRLEGGRPVWLLDRPQTAEAGARFGFVSARDAPRGQRRRDRAYQAPRREHVDPSPVLASVVGDDPEEKSATVLAPFAWQPGMDAVSIADLLGRTRGYEGGVTYLANWEVDDATVSFDTFAELPGEDVVYIKSYGGKVCPEDESCHATIAVQELTDPDFHLDDSQTAVLDIIVWPDGTESLAASADFFRTTMPGGIPNALIFMDVERLKDDRLTRAIKHPSSEYYFWDGLIVVADSLPVIRSYIGELARSGRSPAVVYHEMVDGLQLEGTVLVGVKPFPDGALRIREVVELSDPSSGPLRDGSSIRIDGEFGDGQPDLIHIAVDVEGMTSEEAQSTTVNLLVDGEPRDPPQNPIEGTSFGEYRYGLSWDVEMPDLEEGQEIELDAIAQLAEGGLSRHRATVIAAQGTDLGRVWEGDVSAVSETLWPGVTIKRHTHVIFVRDPDEEPDARRITYLVTGGSTTWEISGSDGQCSFEAGPFEVPLPVDDETDGLTFDVSDAAVGVISYHGMGDLRTGTEIRVTKICEGEDESYTTSMDGVWWLAPQDEGFRTSGTSISDAWSRGATIDTDFSWSFQRVE